MFRAMNEPGFAAKLLMYLLLGMSMLKAPLPSAHAEDHIYECLPCNGVRGTNPRKHPREASACGVCIDS